MQVESDSAENDRSAYGPGTVEYSACESLDRLCQVELRMRGLPVGIVPQLYAIARGDGPPLTLRAAAALLGDTVGSVACVTGISSSLLPVGEVDGPVGAAVLAMALSDLGRPVDVVVPEAMLAVVDRVRRAMGGEFGVVEDHQADPTQYDGVVAIERLGRNRRGVVHTIFGVAQDGQDCTADEFVDAVTGAGGVTIGVGDGGNEIGFGAIFEAAREVVPGGAHCACPCEDGLVTSTATGILFPSAVSNFGTYGIVAAMGILAGRPLMLRGADVVLRGVEAAVSMGCVDGGTFEPGEIADDGVPGPCVGAMVTLLRGVARQCFRETPRHA